MYNKSSVRYYFMDSMRSVLMMLGVVLHSAQVFNPSRSWKIFNKDSFLFAGKIVGLIHMFRMPAFFVISGFFCVLTLNKYTISSFVRIRIKRLVVPLVSTALTLNVLQAFVLDCSGWAKFDALAFINGGWVSHLWFLIVLMAYFLIALTFYTIGREWLCALMDVVNKVVLLIPVVVILCFLPLLSLFFLGMNRFGFPLYYNIGGFLSVYDIFNYLPFFLFGCYLFKYNEALHRFSDIKPYLSVLLVFMAYYIKENIVLDNLFAMRLVNCYLEYFMTWMMVSICFYIFYNTLNYKSNVWLFLSDASFTVYLFNQFIIIVVSLFIAKMKINVYLSFFVLMFVAIFATLALHKYVILKTKLLRFAFNGK